MARYTGPVCRICRHHGDKLMLKGDKCINRCTLERRPTPPGQRSARRRKVSDRGLQLREKQKARAVYGVLERQFRHVYDEAVRRPGVTGENLVRMLEMRLGTVTYRLGFADSLKQARQLVTHGHITLNGRKATIPTMAVRVGDVIGWTPSGARTEYFAVAKETIKNKAVAPWLSLDMEQMTGRVVAEPAIAELELKFDPAAIVEYYSR